MRKLFLSTILSISFSPGFCDSLEERVAALENSMQQIYLQTPNDTCGGRFSAGEFLDCCNCESNCFAVAEILYWHAKAGGTDWVLRQKNAGGLPIKGYTKDCSFTWDFGFRAGLGKGFEKDHWKISLIYTHFRTADTSKVHQNFTMPAGTATVNPQSPGSRGTSQGKFSCLIHYDAIDLNLSRKFFYSPALYLVPALGLKSSLIQVHEKLIAVNFINSLDTFFPVIGSVYTKIKDHCKFLGLGPEGSLDVNWLLGKGLLLTTNASAAVLYGISNVEEKERTSLDDTSGDSQTGRIKLESKTHRMMPWLRLFAGIGYETSWNREKYFLNLLLGYEVEYYWRMIQCFDAGYSIPSLTVAIPFDQSFRANIERGSEDVTFFGITFKMNVRF